MEISIEKPKHNYPQDRVIRFTLLSILIYAGVILSIMLFKTYDALPVHWIAYAINADLCPNYEHHSPCAYDIALLNPATGDIRILNVGKVYRDALEWSHDYQMLLFGQNELYTIDIASGETVQLTQFSDNMPRYPTWSPVDNYVAVFQPVPNDDLNDVDGYNFYASIINPNNPTAPQRLDTPLPASFSPLTRLNWSPDGQYFVSVADSRIITMQMDSGSATKFLFDKDINGYAPDWSPDGTKISFIDKAGDTTEIFVADLQTNTVEQITRYQGNITPPQWLPDNQHLVYIASTLDWSSGGYRMVDISNHRDYLISNKVGIGYDISPDGTELVYHPYGERQMCIQAIFNSAQPPRCFEDIPEPDKDAVPTWRFG